MSELVENNDAELHKSPSAASKADTTVTKDSGNEGHTRQMRVTFNLWSTLGLVYSITATPIGVGSYLTFSLILGGSPFYIYGYIFAVSLNIILCVALAEIASMYPHPSGKCIPSSGREISWDISSPRKCRTYLLGWKACPSEMGPLSQLLDRSLDLGRLVLLERRYLPAYRTDSPGRGHGTPSGLRAGAMARHAGGLVAGHYLGDLEYTSFQDVAVHIEGNGHRHQCWGPVPCHQPAGPDEP